MRRQLQGGATRSRSTKDEGPRVLSVKLTLDPDLDTVIGSTEGMLVALRTRVAQVRGGGVVGLWGGGGLWDGVV